jgi:hypothetical protein
VYCLETTDHAVSYTDQEFAPEGVALVLGNEVQPAALMLAMCPLCSSLLAPRSSLLPAPCPLLPAPCSLLPAPCSLLAPRSSLLAPRSSLLAPRSSLLAPSSSLLPPPYCCSSFALDRQWLLVYG